MLQQLELAFESQPDPRETTHWSSKWVIDFNIGKTYLASFGQSNNSGAADAKTDGSVLEEKSSFKIF